MADKKVIVFPTDFSAASLAALPWARQMAGLLGAEIHCLYVVEEPHIYATLDMGPVPIPSVAELARSAEKRMESFAGEHLGGAEPITTRVLVGRPAGELIRYAKENNVVLIVMATHGYSGIRHVLLGSTTEAVLREASCPVLSIRNS